MFERCPKVSYKNGVIGFNIPVGFTRTLRLFLLKFWRNLSRIFSRLRHSVSKDLSSNRAEGLIGAPIHYP
jgi:hypothetical protein